MIQRRIEFIGRDLGKGRYYHFYGHGGVYEDKIVRKLSPFEVIVHIGCLSGTVSICTKHGFWLGDSFVAFAMLDKPTLKLVRDLLEKQGEK